MDAFSYRLLSHIKRVFEATCGAARYELGDSGADAGARQFYVRNLADNLIRPMHDRHRVEFSRGSGRELEDKMRALRSSSAMTFNILGNECFTVRASTESRTEMLPPGSYRVSYEFQIPTLRRGLSANLDALLDDGEGHVVACEFKYLEWVLGTPRPLRSAYFDHGKYRRARVAEVFVPAAKRLAPQGFKRLDYAQLFRHALALCNACAERRLPLPRTLTLLNAIWEPPNKSEVLSKDEILQLESACNAERREFVKFSEELAPIHVLFEDLGVHFSVAYLPVSKLIFAGCYPALERELLNRYVS